MQNLGHQQEEYTLKKGLPGARRGGSKLEGGRVAHNRMKLGRGNLERN